MRSNGRHVMAIHSSVVLRTIIDPPILQKCFLSRITLCTHKLKIDCALKPLRCRDQDYSINFSFSLGQFPFPTTPFFRCMYSSLGLGSVIHIGETAHVSWLLYSIELVWFWVISSVGFLLATLSYRHTLLVSLTLWLSMQVICIGWLVISQWWGQDSCWSSWTGGGGLKDLQSMMVHEFIIIWVP